MNGLFCHQSINRQNIHEECFREGVKTIILLRKVLTTPLPGQADTFLYAYKNGTCELEKSQFYNRIYFVCKNVVADRGLTNCPTPFADMNSYFLRLPLVFTVSNHINTKKWEIDKNCSHKTKWYLVKVMTMCKKNKLAF